MTSKQLNNIAKCMCLAGLVCFSFLWVPLVWKMLSSIKNRFLQLEGDAVALVLGLMFFMLMGSFMFAGDVARKQELQEHKS